MKKNNLPPIAIQCEHPDSCFYLVGVGENTVSGFFEGIIDSETVNGQEWEVPFDTFMDACAENRIFTDYDQGDVWFEDSRTGLNAKQWAVYWLAEFAGTTEFYAVLRAAVQAQFRADLQRLASTVSKLSGKVWPELVEAVQGDQFKAAISVFQ